MVFYNVPKHSFYLPTSTPQVLDYNELKGKFLSSTMVSSVSFSFISRSFSKIEREEIFYNLNMRVDETSKLRLAKLRNRNTKIFSRAFGKNFSCKNQTRFESFYSVCELDEK